MQIRVMDVDASELTCYDEDAVILVQNPHFVRAEAEVAAEIDAAMIRGIMAWDGQMDGAL